MAQSLQELCDLPQKIAMLLILAMCVGVGLSVLADWINKHTSFKDR
jgi:hypothetical protein